VTLSSTIAAVNAAVAVEVPGTASSVGWAEADDAGAAGRVRWLPISDDPTAAPKLSATTDGLSRALVGLSSTFDVECWASTYEATLTLRDALVRALFGVVGSTAFALGSGRWAQGDALTSGASVTLRVTLRAYVSATAPTVATVATTAFDTTGATDGDGILFVPSDS